jgi:hypothetical protein
MKTPAQVLLAVACIEGRLSAVGDKLRVLLPADCSPELKEAIRQHKRAILSLMKLSFLIVRSDVLNSMVIFVPAEATKELLVAAGAEPGSIYTRGELEILVRSRITPTELLLIHAAKQHFAGTVTP